VIAGQPQEEGAGRSRRPPGARTSERLLPGEHCRIEEHEWYERLEQGEPLHQWGSCFLLPIGDSLWLFLRDVTGAGRHTAAHLDAERAATARAGVEALEVTARALADQLAATRARGSSDMSELRAEQAATEAFRAEAEALYQALLPGRRAR